MEIRGLNVVERFSRRHPDAKNRLRRWVHVTTSAVWRNFAELRSSFGSADFDSPFVVFDIGGNKYRLIAEVEYEIGRVVVRAVLTHVEYDKGKWKLR